MKRLVLFTIIYLISGATVTLAQNSKKAHYIGMNPSVTIEPFYEKGELDVNIFPLVYQHTFSRRIDFRVSGILNYGLRNEADEISHVGAQLALPVYLKKKDDLSLPSQGFFCAPGLGFTRNRIEYHNNIGVWI